ncbi:hypothetical protein [Rothia uropygialis]|uniref:hypothetical protein n=1 Tax=Kocuria sp. 36 TaxID=1415402 RepID=UPI00101CFF3C|nr:hypothetical protein [Kocuria sp. 36]
MRSPVLSRAALATAALVALAPLTDCAGTEPAPAPSGQTSTRTAPSADYEDGTYKAMGEYGGEPSYLDVTITLEDNAITEVTVEPQDENETSRGYQERFTAAVPAAVVGKGLDEAEVGKLADASTCPDGFNDALAQIRGQAKA